MSANLRIVAARHALVGCFLLLGAQLAAAGLFVRLVPSNPGPYNGNENVAVDVFLDNEEAFNLPVIFLRLDFTDSTVDLPPTLTWLLNPPQNGNPNLPLPTWSQTANPQNHVPANGSLKVATLTIHVPRVPGCYRLDVLNRDSSTNGAAFIYQGATGLKLWRAYWSQLTGGALGFPVGFTPGVEVCNGIDDDCDGLVDEDFYYERYDPLTDTVVKAGPGQPCVVGQGNCEVPGILQCDDSGQGLKCVPLQTPPPPRTEGPYGHSTCRDLQDNDCDGLVDGEDPDCTGPELCDYLDNDNNGIADDPWLDILGTPCVVGLGACQKTGTWICSADGLGVECSVKPAQIVTEVEGPPGHPRCSDGFDNDCDGLKDLDDPDCQAPEICDGLDNNGDGRVDEPWADVLGTPCTVGTGACERTGTWVCRADGSGIHCSVTPGPAKPEGPGCDCGDGIDNDCDGLIDLDDPDCGASVFRARAALPLICSAPDGDCWSWHHVQYDTLNGGPGTQTTAELLALDIDGNVLGTLSVLQGDEVRLRSRTLAADLAFDTVSQVFNAQAAMNLETCLTGPDIPTLPATECQYFETDCDGDVDMQDVAVRQAQFGHLIRFHRMTAPIPLLRVQAHNAVAKATAYASIVPHIQVWNPDDTVVVINEADRTYVDIALPNVDPASLALKLDGQNVFAALGLNPATDFPGGPYGGSVNLPNNCTAQICELVVDTADTETLAAHSLRMVVENMCCGGHIFVLRGDPLVGSYPDPVLPPCAEDDFRSAGISNGFEITIIAPAEGSVDPSPPTAVTGIICHGQPLRDPPNTPGQVWLNGLLQTTNAPAFVLGDGEDSADRYTYLFTSVLNQTNLFQDFTGGGVPGTIDPGSNVLVGEARDREGNAAFDTVKFALKPVLPGPEEGRTRAAIDRGIVLSVTATALDTIVTRALETLFPTLIDELLNMVNDLKGTQFTIETDACNPKVTVFPNWAPGPIIIPPDLNNFVINAVPSNDKVDLTVVVPQMYAEGTIAGRCEIEGLFGECFIEVVIRIRLEVTVDEATLKLTITEGDLLNGNDVTPTLTIDPSDVHINIADIGSDVGCWGGILAEIFSFGLAGVIVDAVISDKIEDYIDDLDVTQYIGLIPVPPISLDFFELDPLDLGALNVALALALKEVEITPSGLAASMSTEFTPTVIDPEVQVLPGTPLTPASLPMPPLPVPALSTAIMMSDDAANQMLYALTRNGIFKTQYEDVRTLGSFLPANCGTLSPVEQGQCVAIKGLPCGGLAGDALLSCLATSVLLDALNLQGNTPVILHGRLDVAPKFYPFRTTGGGASIVAYLRLSQVYVGVVADRDGNGVVMGDYGALPSCFGNPATATPCVLWGGCYDVNIALSLTLQSPGGIPELAVSVVNVALSNATGCQGAVVSPGGLGGFEDAFAGQVFDIIKTQIDNNVPPIQLEGLDFGGIVNLQGLKLLLFGTENDLNFEDYFGMTADPQ